MLRLIRDTFTAKSTIGELFDYDTPLCDTLEDVVRPAGEFVPDATAIPEGTYEIIIDLSVRFRRRMPLLLNVPGRTGIRIHSGNTSDSTTGCILVGERMGPDFITKSMDTFNGLIFPLIEERLEVGRLFIEIVNKWPPSSSEIPGQI
jgi:hypothetical protein